MYEDGVLYSSNLKALLNSLKTLSTLIIATQSNFNIDNLNRDLQEYVTMAGKKKRKGVEVAGGGGRK